MLFFCWIGKIFLLARLSLDHVMEGKTSFYARVLGSLLGVWHVYGR